ncbi:MAG TPA: HD domain-containing protein [Acidobacteriaceae bacterium]|nr:HD domain-containing protein [Acidobacteriaceae bacterium]
MVADLASRENREITGFFSAALKQVRTGRDGGRYLALTLADRTGQIDGRMWEIDDAGEFDAGDVVKVLGEVCRFNERLQIKVKKIRRAAAGEFDLGDFVSQSKRDLDEMWTELLGRVASFHDADLKALLAAFLADAQIAEQLKHAPAARGLHHAWIGGLLEHILSLMAMGELAAQHYPEVNRDLLMTGVVLHDIGKLRELSWGTSFDYTLEGQLLGHITIGIGMIEAKIAAIPNFPPAKRLLVEHLVLSHHGEYEFGSPKLPMTAEAILLHYLDNLDAKMQTVRTELAKAQANGRAGDEMTEWVRSMDRQLLSTDAFLVLHAADPIAAVTAAPEAGAQEPAVAAAAGVVEKVELALNGKREEEREEERNHALPFEN